MAKKESISRGKLEGGAAAVGATLGVGGASAIGTVVGSSGLLGTIGSAFGLTIAAATPVGWLLGGAAVGATLLYGGAKLVGAKGYADGDYNAFSQFSSDDNKKKYMHIQAKLSQSEIVNAEKLLGELPDEYSDFRIEMLSAMKEGSASAIEVIEICCEVLNKNVDTYLDKTQVSLNEIFLVLKMGFLMSLVDGEASEEELEFAINKPIEMFNLNDILDKSEIKFIRASVFENEDELERIRSLSLEEIHILMASFFMIIQNEHIKQKILVYLSDIAKVDNTLTKSELNFLELYEALMMTESRLDAYVTVVNQAIESTSNTDLSLFSVFTEHNTKKDKFVKKRGNALNAYAKGLPPELCRLVYDDTVFGKADEGFLVTPYGIATSKKKLGFVPYSKIKYSHHVLKLYKMGKEEKSYFKKFFGRIIEINQV